MYIYTFTSSGERCCTRYKKEAYAERSVQSDRYLSFKTHGVGETLLVIVIRFVGLFQPLRGDIDADRQQTHK